VKRPVLVKLGGSVVTFKDRPLSANVDATDGISRVLTGISPLVIVHGGGSFGHHWSVKYNMHTKPAAYDLHGVAVVHESMMALNQVIVNSMIKAGANPYALAPSVYTSGHKPLPTKIKEMGIMAGTGMIPVTYGDVVHMGGRKYSILSGDALMTILAKVLRPARVIFATNVDGIFKDMDSKELVSEMQPKGRVEFSGVLGADVTGGMQRKVGEAFKIASLGMDVMMVNGLVPGRIADAVEGRMPIGTLVRRRR
jgi:isopentenyl phosphate kinase